MATNARKPMKTMRDAMGNDIPVKYVKPYDKQRDRTVRRILRVFQDARKALEEVVAYSVAEMDALAKCKESLGEKGNFSAQSFDGLVRVSIDQNYTITLDERVVRARALMLSYVEDELSVIGDKATVVKKIVEAAFKTDRKGFLSRSKINELLALNVNDERWNEGARILCEALTTVRGKRYLSCAVRSSTQEDFQNIKLDIADCWPRPAPVEAQAE